MLKPCLCLAATVGLTLGGLSALSTAEEKPAATGMKFTVTVAPGLLEKPTDGRVLVVLQRGGGRAEPRFTIGQTGMDAPPVLGADANGFAPGKEVTLGAKSAIFPIDSLAKLPAGDYSVQAVFHFNRDLNLPDAPGNLYSPVQRVRLDPAAAGDLHLELSSRLPAETMPRDTDTMKYIHLESKLLSRFHGRPMYLRAGLVLPTNFRQEPDRKYPLRVHIGGYGTRYTAVRFLQPNEPFLQLLLDGAGPYGDPYYVNSDNNGPYGDALTQELIPYVEKTYRGIGAGWARVTDGASTGGWVSFALQVFYPDYFNGCWSDCPDPVDFRCYELINIYEDENAYVNRYGFERPAKRTVDGETVYTVRHECQVENVLGRGDSWVTSGKDWCAWNAVFGPRGADGRPKPLWEPKSGAIDRSVTDHWRKYDLRLVLQSNWPELAPRLKGKIRVWVGDGDDYFLNNAVHRLDEFLRRARPAYEGTIEFGPRAGHRGRPLTERQKVAQMWEAVQRAKP